MKIREKKYQPNPAGARTNQIVYYPGNSKGETRIQKEIQQKLERIKAHGAAYVDARYYPLEEANDLLMRIAWCL